MANNRFSYAANPTYTILWYRPTLARFNYLLITYLLTY